MSIDLIGKIKPKNNGKFALVDAEDIEMPDGSRLPNKLSTQIATVFGDSFMNNPDIGYEFGDWLEKQGRFSKVHNFARGGSGFATTFSYVTEYSLYELLKKNDVKNAIKESDVIFIHLGGNDINGAFVEDPSWIGDTDLFNKATSCISTIVNLNPKAIIKITPFINISFMVSMAANISALGYTRERYETMLIKTLRLFSELQAIDGNIFFNCSGSTELIWEQAPDGLHPTINAVNSLFTNYLDGNYEKSVVRLMWTSSSMLPSIAVDYAAYVNALLMGASKGKINLNDLDSCSQEYINNTYMTTMAKLALNGVGISSSVIDPGTNQLWVNMGDITTGQFVQQMYDLTSLRTL